MPFLLPKSSAELCLQLALQLQRMRDLMPTALGFWEMFCVSLQEAPPSQTHKHKTAPKCLSNQQRNRSRAASCVFMHSNTCPVTSLFSVGTWHLLGVGLSAEILLLLKHQLAVFMVLLRNTPGTNRWFTSQGGKSKEASRHRNGTISHYSEGVICLSSPLT